MKKILILLTFLCSFNALAETLVKVAVIDTGLDMKYSKSVPLCRDGHKDFTGEGLNDNNGHGTNIVGLIVNSYKPTGYCIVLIKAFSRDPQVQYVTQALEYAEQIQANIINLSGGGPNPIKREREVVMRLLDKNIILSVAAGNDNVNLDEDCNYYPACYDPRIYVVGNSNGRSNYGKVVDIWYNGQNKTEFGVTRSGTSQSTAQFTSQLLKTVALIKKKM